MGADFLAIGEDPVLLSKTEFEEFTLLGVLHGTWCTSISSNKLESKFGLPQLQKYQLISERLSRTITSASMFYFDSMPE